MHGLNHRFQKVKRRKLSPFNPWDLGEAFPFLRLAFRCRQVPWVHSYYDSFHWVPKFSPPNLAPGLVAWFLVLAGDWLSELVLRLDAGSRGGGRREFVWESVVEGTDEDRPGKLKRPRACDLARVIAARWGRERGVWPSLPALRCICLRISVSIAPVNRSRVCGVSVFLRTGKSVFRAGEGAKPAGRLLSAFAQTPRGPVGVDWVTRASGISTGWRRREEWGTKTWGEGSLSTPPGSGGLLV